MKYKRRQCVVGTADPTQFVMYTSHFGKFEIQIEQGFGDVTARVYFGSRQLLFTSREVCPLINRYFESVYKELEFKEVFAKESQEEDDYPEFCWYCGSTDLRTSEGYVGEEIVFCECGKVLYEEPVSLEDLS